MHKKSPLIPMIIAVAVVLVAVYAAYTAYTPNKGPRASAPPTPSPGQEALEVSDNMSDIIRSVMESLGEAPNNVVGFGLGFKRPQGTAITPEENAVLRTAFDVASRRFASDKGNMGCQPTVDTEAMMAFTEGDVKGYSDDLSAFIGRSGYTEYDSLGNLDERVGKTVIHFVSLDKSVKQVDSQAAQSLVANAQVYAYWIESVPEENKLHGQVFNRGTDQRTDEPVTQGTLRFLRIGPNPSSTDEAIEVKKDKSGRYDADGKLTAGHYEVSFDAKDGQGYRIITPNWLYLPGDHDDTTNEPKNWYVLVNTTYRITYEHSAKTAGTNEKVHTAQIVWEDISIDWLTESQEALTKGQEAGFSGTYCLTYDYDKAEDKEADQDASDESEAEITPGYFPTTFNEVTTKEEATEIKLLQVPTLSFYRGARDNAEGYVEEGFYMCIPAEIAIFVYPVDQVTGTALIPGIFEPMTESAIASAKAQGWDEFAFLGKLDTNDVKALIETGAPMEIYYEHPGGAFVKVIIEPYFEK